jgi:hypothetical protein
MNDEPNPNLKKHNPVFIFIWLLVGLAPIPMVLIMISAVKPGSAPAQSLIPIALVVVPACNLLGGIGCLGGIKNVAVRIILGIFLAAFFFALTAIVAVFQACSHSGGL